MLQGDHYLEYPANFKNLRNLNIYEIIEKTRNFLYTAKQTTQSQSVPFYLKMNRQKVFPPSSSFSLCFDVQQCSVQELFLYDLFQYMFRIEGMQNASRKKSKFRKICSVW